MASHILRDIARFIQQARYFAVMADEVSDSSNIERFIICFRRIDEDFQTYEDFIGLNHVASIQADVLVGGVKDAMLHMGLGGHNCHARLKQRLVQEQLVLEPCVPLGGQSGLLH